MPTAGFGLKIQMVLVLVLALLWLLIDFIASDQLLAHSNTILGLSLIVGLLCLYMYKAYWIEAAEYRKRTEGSLKTMIKLFFAVFFVFFLLPVWSVFMCATLIFPSLVTMAIGEPASRVLVIEQVKYSSYSGYKGRGSTRRLYAHFDEGFFWNSSIRASSIKHSSPLQSGDRVLVTGKASWAGIFLNSLEVIND